MSQGLRESLLSYQFSRTERSRAASSSTESPPSPSDSLRSRSPQPSRRARPQLRIRPHSSGERVCDRIRVQTIEEGSDRVSIQSTQQHNKSLRRARSSEGIDVQSLDNVITSAARSSERGGTTAISASLPRVPTETPADSVSSKAKTPRPSWARTRSGGVWYRDQKNTSSHEGSSIRSARSAASNRKQSEPASISVVPLKPPPRPERLQISPTNHIVIEQPFGHDKVDAPESNLVSPLVEDLRRSSIDVKRLFSAPLLVFRRSLGDRFGKLPSPSPNQTPTSSANISSPDRKLLSKADQIAITLNRVSSLLEGQKRSKFKTRVRSFSHKTVSNTSSSDPNDSRQSRAAGLLGTSPLRNKSLDHFAEIASSILDIHMGSTPQNSPTEKATYKIKRSPSAETEEFLKIDISIRGGTSYLASEAHRISTPPLPDADPTGLRKGFFFDYTAPNFHEFCGELQPEQQHTCSKSQDHPVHNPTALLGIDKRTTTGLQRSPSRKTASRVKTGDWYDTQLADLDTTTVDTITNISTGAQSSHQCKHECQARLAEIKRQQYEARLDFDIPEHLPNSPICPRNPRYWRVKQKKGSQFRGCWMHGFGEYDVVPGLVK